MVAPGYWEIKQAPRCTPFPALYQDGSRTNLLQERPAISLPKVQGASRVFTWGCMRPGTEESIVVLLISIGLSICRSARKTQKRRVKPSGHWLGTVARNGGF